MFYALGSIGSFADGARTRQKEQRVERAAIREEFDRWKANNPNATAMDFHTKVKQLGATTPGGGSVLPDASSIQRMAAENLRRKQEEEADRARKLRSDNMNMQLTENTLARQLLTDAPDMSASDLLSSMNLPTTATTLAWAEGIQKSEKRKLEQATAQGKLREQAQQFEQRKAMAAWMQEERRLNPLLTDQEIRDRGTNQFGPIYNTAVSTPSGGSPVTSTPATYGPVQQAPATQRVGVNDEAVRLITGQLDTRLATAKTPAEVQATVQAVAQEASSAGRTSEEISASLANSAVYAGQIKAFRTQSFDQILNNAQDIPNLTIVVRGKGNTQPISLSLEEMSNSAFNNTRFVEDAYIPPSAENYVADRLSTYFTIDKDGSHTLIDGIAAMEPSARVNYIMKDLEQFGVVAKSDIRQARDATLAAAPDITSVQQYVDILDGDDVGSYPVKRDLEKIAAEADKTTQAEREAAKQVLLNTIDTHARIFASGDTVSIYSAGFADIRDLLPPGADADMAPLEQWFKDTRKLIEDFDTSKGYRDPSEVNKAEAEAKFLDRAMATSSEPVTEDASNAAVEALGDFGFARGLLRGFKADDSGEMSQQYPTNTELSKILVQGGASQKAAVTHAMASAFEAFEAQRGTGLQYDRPKGRQGLMSIIAGFIDAEVSAVNQAMSQFPGYNRAVADATRQFSVTLETTAGTSGLSSKEIEELKEDFDAYIKQATRQRRFVNPNSFGGEPIPNVTQMDLMAPSSQGLPSGARIIQR